MGKNVVILHTSAMFRPLAWPLERLANILLKNEIVQDVDTVFPELAQKKGTYCYNRIGMYVDSEAWIMESYGFDKFVECIPEVYVLPAKQEIAKHIFSLNPLVFSLNFLQRMSKSGTYTVAGLPVAAVGLYSEIFGEPGFKSIYRQPKAQLLNIILAFTFAAYSIFDHFFKVKIKVPNPQTFDLGIDWVFGGGEIRHNRIALELADPNENVIVVRRNRTDNYDGSMDGHSVVVFGDQICSLRNAVVFASSAIHNIGVLTINLCKIESSIFWRLVTLPVKHAKWQRFFGQYPCRRFWGRDEYNAEHHLRTHELRSAGALSVGISHGIMGWGIIEPQIRFIDFDVYFTFGIGLYERHYYQYWPKRMRVVPVGSFGMSRDELMNLSAKRPKNILLFLDPAVDGPDGLSFGFDLAREFSDRKLLVKIKQDRETAPYYKELIGMLQNTSLENVIQVTSDTYALMFQARYAISGLSTVAAECLQFGLASWALDLDEDTKYVHYREFEDFCVDCSDQIIARIRGIENNVIRYPRETYREMIDLSGKIIYDVIRREVGLSEKQPGTIFSLPMGNSIECNNC